MILSLWSPANRCKLFIIVNPKIIHCSLLTIQYRQHIMNRYAFACYTYHIYIYVLYIWYMYIYMYYIYICIIYVCKYCTYAYLHAYRYALKGRWRVRPWERSAGDLTNEDATAFKGVAEKRRKHMSFGRKRCGEKNGVTTGNCMEFELEFLMTIHLKYMFIAVGWFQWQMVQRL